MRVLYTELERAYAARTGAPGEAAALLALQYADFATWQRRRVSGDRLEGLTSFWREELDGATPVDLPTDRPRPPVFGHAGASATSTSRPGSSPGCGSSANPRAPPST